MLEYVALRDFVHPIITRGGNFVPETEYQTDGFRINLAGAKYLQ